MIVRPSIRMANSEGMVISTVGPDLLHMLGSTRSGVRRTAIIRKVLVYNNTGAPVTVSLGTRDTAAPPVFVQYIPSLVAPDGTETVWTEEQLPAVEFSVVTVVPLVLANCREGNIWLQASAVDVQVLLEVEEFGS